MTALVWFTLGILALIGGSELIVRGGSRLAARLGTPPIVIGLTVVAIGTSTPELAIGIDAGLVGAGSLAVGNIAGTNTVNILLILGLSALLRPLALHSRTLRFDLPIMTVVALAMLAMAFDGTLSRAEGAVLVCGSVAFTIEVVRWARKESAAVRMAAVAFLCIPVFVTGRRVTRVEGAMFVAAYVVYVAYLVMART